MLEQALKWKPTAGVEQRSCSPRDSSATVHYAASKSVASSSSCSNTLSLRSKSPTRFYESTPHGSNNNNSNPPNSSARSKENERTNNNIAGLSPSSSIDALEKALCPLNVSSRRLERSTSPDQDEDAGFEVSLVREFSDTTAPSPDRRTARFANMDSRAQSSHPQQQPSTPNGLHRFSSLNLRGSMDKGISSSRSSGSNNSFTKKNNMGREQEDGPPPPTATPDASTSNGYSTKMNSLLSSVGTGLGYPLTSFTRSSSSNISGSSSILADKEQKVARGILRNKPTSLPHTAHNSDVKPATKVQKLVPVVTSRTRSLREQSADTCISDAPYTTDWQSFMRDLLMFHNKNEGSNNTTTMQRQKSVRFHPSVLGKVESQFDDSIEYDDDSDWNTLETKETSKSNNPPLWMRVMNKLVHGRSLESDRYQGRSSSYPSQSGAITRFQPQVGRSQESGSDWMPNLDWGGMPGILDRDDPWTNYEDDSTWGTLETKESLARPRDDMSLVPLPEDFLYHETYYGCGMRIAKYYDRIFEDNGHGYQGRRQPVPIILLNDMLDERIQQKRGFDQFDDNSIASSRGHGPVSI
jgi:hypothetical protein